MSNPHRILVGVIGAPHGVRGEMRVKSYTETPTALGRYRPLTTQDGDRTFTILALRPVKDDMVVVSFDGVTTRDAAAALTNTRLYVDRAVLPPAADDEYYHADLIGLRAETDAGQDLGRVTRILNFGAGDLLELQPPEGESVLVAFTEDFVPIVDLASGRVVVTAEALAAGDPDAAPPQAGLR